MGTWSGFFRRPAAAAPQRSRAVAAVPSAAGEWLESSLALQQGLEVSEHELTPEELAAFAEQGRAPVLDQWTPLLRRN